jgi:uncharacterized protein (UPF0276 family)
MHKNPYGVGLAYRYVIHDDVMRYADRLDLLEITTEDYIDRQRLLRGDANQHLLREALAALPATAHGLTLSIGSVAEANTPYLEGTRRFLEEHQIDTFSEHLAFHQMDGTDLGIFLPMPFEEIAIQWLKRAYYQARAALGRPFALENVTYYFPVPHCGLSEADFLRRLTEETDCTLLLDVTNVFNNSHNHGYDPIEFLDRLPLERVSQIHLAGGHQTDDGRWEDSHSTPVMEPVWPLFEEVVRRTKAGIVILERDSKFDPFETVVDDIDRAREIFYRYRSETPPQPAPVLDATGTLAADPDAPEFRELRAFQRTLLARLTDPQFRAEFTDDPIAAARRMGINSGDWVKRIANCDPAMFHWMAEGWDRTRADESLFEQDSENNEWTAWAAQLAKS